MKILYGVVGEGMGHATRSKVVCEHLLSQGDEVKIVVSGRAYGFLAKTFPDVVEIKGLTIRYVDNRMDLDGTVAGNMLAAPSMLADNVGAYLAGVADFKADAVITDFDSFAYWYAKRHRLPIISIDNQQIISRCKHEKVIRRGHKLDFELTKAFVKAKLPACDEYIITSFFSPPIKKKYSDNTRIVPPILRQPILDAKSRSRPGHHVLVYQTSKSDSQLIKELNAVVDSRFIVYGLGRNERAGNCTMKEFSEAGFIDDLATSSAVISNGGLSLIGEAIFLGKPILSIPVQKQFEQIMNARYLEELGYGMGAERIDATTVKRFLRDASGYAARVSRHHQVGNEELFDSVDSILRRFVKRMRRK